MEQNIYLDAAKKKAYMEDFKSLLKFKDEYWKLDEDLNNPLSKINSNEYVQTLYSKRKNQRSKPEDGLSYLGFCYFTELETELKKSVIPSLCSCFNILSGTTFSYGFSEPKENNNYVPNSKAIGIGCVDNKDYFYINHCKIELQSSDTNIHNKFWEMITEKLLSLKPQANTDYISGIKKTGFILEYEITQILKRNHWSIINNKFYEDDLANSVREMDILAYKASNIEDVILYTVILISCKKNENNAWALISRNINLEDPNSNWWPIHIWTNDKATKHELESMDANKQYYQFIYKQKGVDIMQPPSVDIFAFQELSKKNGNPQNDTNIFSSLTTLMKAQSYEFGSLDKRSKSKRIYQFNLISIIESDLIRLHISDNNKIEQSEIESEQFVARYIINKKEQFFRIRFIRSDIFNNYIDSYNRLHDSNIELFTNYRDTFYKDLIKDYKKIELVENDFYSKIVDSIYIASNFKLNKNQISNDIFVHWKSSENYLQIFVTEDKAICDQLNKNKELHTNTKKYLWDILKYNGEFKFETDVIPF